MDGGTIEKCTVSGNIIQYNRVGGVVGTALSGTIKNCTVTANITSNNVTDSSYIKPSYNDYSYAGGIIGYCGNRDKSPAQEVTVTGCTVGGTDGTMTISANGWSVGAVSAWMAAGSNLTVESVTIKNVKLENKYKTTAGAVVGDINAVNVTLTLKSVKLDGSINYTTTKDSTQTTSTNTVNNVTISSSNISEDKKSITYEEDKSLVLIAIIKEGATVVVE